MREAPLPDEYSVGKLMREHVPLSRIDCLPGGWTAERARSARDAQMRGNFRESALLHEATKTDPQILGAMLNRIAPHRGLPREVTGGGVRIVDEAKTMLAAAVSPAVDADAFEWACGIGVQVETVHWTMREDGGRLDPLVEPWPMRTVWWDSYREKLCTLTTNGIQEITHGDGKWIVTKLQSAAPWQSAALKAVADHWAKRAAHLRDRALNSETHGEAKILGTLPEGMNADDDGAKAFAELVNDLRKRRSGGIKPFGSTVELLEAMSQMWRVFQDAIASIDKDVARAWLGQDGSLINEGGNYVKTALLFGVRNDLVEGDLAARALALTTGLLRPWSIVNVGRDVGLATRWLFPDADRDARIFAYTARVDAFNRAIAEYKANGFEVDQNFVDELAKSYDVTAPTLIRTSSTSSRRATTSPLRRWRRSRR